MVPSENVAVAVNCWLLPRGMLALLGMIAMDEIAPGVITTISLALIEAEVAVIVRVPVLDAVSRPCVPAALLTSATLGSEEAHTTEPVRSCVLPSL